MINNELFDKVFLSDAGCTIKRHKLYKKYNDYVVKYIVCGDKTAEYVFPIGEVIFLLKKYFCEKYDLIIESAFAKRSDVNYNIKGYAKVLKYKNNRLLLIKKFHDNNEFEAIIIACNWIFENLKENEK